MAGTGEGISARTFSFDHIIRGNTIVLANPKQPAVRLGTADCTGVEIIGNTVFGGSGSLVGGPGRPLIDRDNTFAPLTEDAAGPSPKVPSIFRWQRQERP